MGFFLTEIAKTKSFKNAMAKVYGIGASVVLMGALFKIQHWPGASVMLIVGLSTEAFIFFMSAWEPPHQEWDWSLVYPQLAGIETEEPIEDPALKDKSVLEKLNNLLENSDLSPELFNKLSDGLKNLINTTEKIADVSNASLATNNFVQSFNLASNKINEFTDSYMQSTSAILNSALKLSSLYENKTNEINSYFENLAQKINISGEKFSQVGENFSKIAQNLNKASEEINQKINETFNKTLNTIDSSINLFTNAVIENVKKTNDEYTNEMKSLIEKLKESGKYLIDSYKSLTDSLVVETETTKLSVKNYTEQIQQLVKNISALNSLYELQLQTTTSLLDGAKKSFSEVDELIKTISNTQTDVENYRKEINKLANNLSALNTIYGNMLAAMNFSIKQ